MLSPQKKITAQIESTYDRLLVIFTQVTFGLSILYASIFAVTQTQLTATIPMILMSLAVMSVMANYRSIRWQWSLQSILFLSLVGYAIIRALFSPVKSLAEQDLFLIIVAASTYGIIVFSKVRNRASWNTLFIGLLIVIASMNVLTLIPVVNDFRDSVLGFADGGPNTGMYNHRNFFSNMMMMCALVFLPITVCTNYNKSLRVVLGILFLCCTLALALASARASIVGYGAGVFIFVMFLMLKLQFKRKLIWILMSVAFLMIGTFGIKMVWSEALQQRANLEKNNTTVHSAELGDRSAYFAMAIDQFIDNPIIGNGSRSYIYLSYQDRSEKLSPFGLNHLHVHNEYLQALCEYGIIGFFLVFAFIIYHFKGGLIRLFMAVKYPDEKGENKLSPNDWAWILVGVCLCVGGSINMLLSFPAHCMPNLIIFVIGLSLTGRSLLKPEKRTSSILSTLPLLMLYFVMICLTWLLGHKELMASRIFKAYDITVDDMNWQVNKVDHKSWQPALEGAMRVAPSFDRANKLGALYLHKSQQPSDESLKNEWRLKAYKQFSLSKKMHPLDPVSRINLAEILSNKGDYEKADKEFQEVEGMAKHREAFFLFYSAWAANDRALAVKFWQNGKREEAIRRIKTGLDKCRESRKLLKMNFELPSVAREQYYLAELLFQYLHSAGYKEESIEFLDNVFIPLAKGKMRYMDNIKPLQAHTKWIFNYAMGLWNSQNYSRAREVFEEVYRQYMIVESRMSLTPEAEEQYTMTKNLLTVLRSKNFSNKKSN